MAIRSSLGHPLSGHGIGLRSVVRTGRNETRSCTKARSSCICTMRYPRLWIGLATASPFISRTAIPHRPRHRAACCLSQNAWVELRPPALSSISWEMTVGIPSESAGFWRLPLSDTRTLGLVIPLASYQTAPFSGPASPKKFYWAEIAFGQTLLKANLVSALIELTIC